MEDMYKLLESYLNEDQIKDLKEEMSKDFSNKGLILNTLRCPRENLDEFILTQDTDDKNLYLYKNDETKPGKNILHEAGAYYILDPSAVIIRENLVAEDKEFVIDLCAAPGGKTISYALKNPHSVIIANDFSLKRCEELSKNVERMGLANVIVTNYEPKEFLKNFSNYFDKVILDTPCSGTGMFRKEKKVLEDWSKEKVDNLLPLQDSLLEVAYGLLKEGGYLSYSTCSFLKEEDEDRLSVLLNNHDDLEIIELKHQDGFLEGTIKNTLHLLPSLYKKGEGHFISILRKKGDRVPNEFKLEGKFDETLNLYTFKYKNEIYGLPYLDKRLLKLDSLRFGVKITNSTKYSKCEYDHALSHYLSSKDSLDLTEQEALSYLEGNEVSVHTSHKDGLITVSYKNVNLGFGKLVKGRIKNYYPKGLRKRI